MSFEEEFDDGIRQKLDGLSYPFDDQNWEKASRMLDAERKANGSRFKRVYPFLVAGAVLLVTGIAVVGGLQSETPLAATSSGPMNETVVRSAGNSVTAPVVQVQSPVAPSATKILLPGETAHSTATAHNPSQDMITSAHGVASVKKAARPASNNSNAGNPNAAQTGGNDLPLSTGHNSGFTQPAASNNLPAETLPATETQPATGVALQNDEVVVVETLLPVQMLLPADDHASEPVVAIQATKKHDDYYGKNRKKINFINVEAGLAYLTGWHTNAGTDGSGLNWYAGANYGLYLTRSISLSGGIQAYNIAHITSPFYSGQSTEYTFNSTTTETVITTNSMYYLSFPLKLYYDLNPFSRISAGVNAGYLVSASNNVTVYNIQDGGRQNVKSDNIKGVYQSVQTKSILLTASYAAKINKRISISGEVIYGLTDLFANTDFKKDVEKPIGLRLGLQYMIHDK